MEQVKTDRKKIMLWCLLSAGIAGILFVVFSAINGLMPFGEMSALRNDASAQYAPFLAEYITKIKSGNLSFWNWSLGGGTNELAFVGYYLLSPFNLFALPFKTADIEVAFWFVIFVKTMAIALTSCYFFQRKFSDSGLLPMAFSLVFTFSGFYLAYYFNTMWLDAVMALPLIALGIENIVNGKKATLYFFSLAYAIFVNFYMGYMICLFSVMYFFYLLFAKDVSKNTAEKDKDELPIMQVMLKYGFASAFAGLVCFVIILPVIYAMGNANSRSNFDQTEAFFNLFDFLSAHLSGINANVNASLQTGTTIPILTSSMLVIASLPLFLFNKTIKINKKIASVFIVALLFFSMMIPKMNFFWHGFSEPTGLPYRFTYIYLFFIIVLAYEAVKNIRETPVWAFGFSAILAIVAMVYTKFSSFADSLFSSKAVIVSAIAFTVFVVLLLLKKFERLNSKAFSALVCVCLIAEIAFNGTPSIAALEPNLVVDYDRVIEAVDTVKSISPDKQTRLEILVDGNEIKAYSSIYDYNGMSIFSSLTDNLYAITQMTLGNYGNYSNGFFYVAQTPIYNALFSMDYVLDPIGKIDDDNPYYEKVAEFEAGTVYKVKYSLPMGYCVDENVDRTDPFNNFSFSVQRQFWRDIADNTSTMTDVNPNSIVPYNCEIVDYDVMSEYEKENGKYDEHDDNDEHEHDNDAHEHEDSTGYSDPEAESITGDTWAELVGKVGSTYPIKLTGENSSVTFEITAAQEGEIFVQINNFIYNTLAITRADGTKFNADVAERHIVDIGYYKAGEKCTLVLCEPEHEYDLYNHDGIVNGSVLFQAVTVNEEEFLQGYNKILENGVLDIDEFEDTHIHGTVNSTIDGYMMMPMPYDLGWTIWVDGEEIEPHEHESHIMMFEITKGQHEIEMKYFPQGLKEGIFVSVAAVLGLVLVLLLGRVHKMKLELEAEEEAKKAAEAADGDAQSVSVSAQGEGEADGASPPESEE